MSKPAPTFRIDSQPIPSTRLVPAAQRACDHLDLLPFGEMLTIAQLARALNHDIPYLSRIAAQTDWDGRRILQGARYLYGSQKTISAYRAHLGI